MHYVLAQLDIVYWFSFIENLKEKHVHFHDWWALCKQQTKSTLCYVKASLTAVSTTGIQWKLDNFVGVILWGHWPSSITLTCNLAELSPFLY